MIEYLVSLVGPVLALLGSIAVAVFNYRRAKVSDNATNTLTQRRDTIADRDALIDQLQEDMSDLKRDMVAQKAETESLRREISLVRDHNNALISYVYRLISLLRLYGHQNDIPVPTPDGIHL